MADPVAVQVLSVFGRLKAFDPEAENISTYLERVELYFEANSVNDEKKVSVLFTVIGPKNYGIIIRSLVAPDRPKDKTYAQLEIALKAHYQPKPLVIAERFQFYQRCQNSTESMQQSCNYLRIWDSALQDRFVCGLRTEQIQKSLLTEGALTMSRAAELAQAKEAASRDAKNFKGSAAAALLQLAGSGDHSPSQGRKPCYRCRKLGHLSTECKYKQSKCHKCGKQGHIAPVCRSKKKPTDHKNPSHKVKRVDADHSSEEGTEGVWEHMHFPWLILEMTLRTRLRWISTLPGNPSQWNWTLALLYR